MTYVRITPLFTILRHMSQIYRNTPPFCWYMLPQYGLVKMHHCSYRSCLKCEGLKATPSRLKANDTLFVVCCWRLLACPALSCCSLASNIMLRQKRKRSLSSEIARYTDICSKNYGENEKHGTKARTNSNSLPNCSEEDSVHSLSERIYPGIKL